MANGDSEDIIYTILNLRFVIIAHQLDMGMKPAYIYFNSLSLWERARVRVKR